MEFRILGPLEVTENGRRVELGGARQRALLSILVLYRGTVVSADQLVDDLYGARPPATAAKSLQAHISRLRKALGSGERLVTRGRGYVLELGHDDVDVDLLGRLVEDGRRALAAGDVETAEAALERALTLRRGAPFADLAYHDVAQGEIARVEELQLAALEELCACRLELGRQATLIPELEQLVVQYPLRERLRAQLMLALYRCGRQADALSVYQEGRRLLVEDLGIEPGRDLQELERAILNQDPGLEPAVREAVEEPVRAGRLAAGIFVGRTRELAQLEDALADARAGRGRLVLLDGEAGIGKSRLADELSSRAKDTGAGVLWGRCWEAGGAPAFWPWVQALRTHVQETEPEALLAQLGRCAPDVAHLLPELRELFPEIPVAPELDSDGARFRLFDSTATFLRRAAASRALVIVIDDLHAGDTSSLLLLDFVAAEIATARVLILAAYREPVLDRGDPRTTALADLARRASMHISLGGLAHAEVAAYIELSSPTEAPASLVTAIASETEGNPLFVGEIVRLLSADGRLFESADHSWRPVIPETVKEVIGRRLHHLSAPCREILAIASVIGREFGLDALGRIAGCEARELLGILDEARRARVVMDVPGSPGRMRFAHALTREALYDSVPQDRRLELHQRTVAALEAAAIDDTPHLSQLAHHSFEALPSGDANVAVAYAQRAAEQARDLLAHEEAARLYASALQAFTMATDPQPGQELALLLALGESLTRAGDRTRAKDAFLRAASLARAIGSAADLGVAALGYSGRIVWTRQGGDRLVVPLLEEALSELGEEPTPLRSHVLARLAGALRDERDPGRRVALGEVAVATARRTGDASSLAYALAGLCGALHGIGEHEPRLTITRELAEVSRRVGDKEHEFEALIAEAMIYLERGDMHEVRERFATISMLGDELRQPSHQWFAFTNHALLALHEGRFEDAEEFAERGYEIGKRAEPEIAVSVHALQLYEVRRQQGRDAEVYDLLATVARDNLARPVFRCALAQLALELGRLSDARQLYEELASTDFAVVPRDNEWLLAASYLVEVCRGLGDAMRAAVLYDLLAPSAGKIASDLAEGCGGSVERLLGVLALMLGREQDAISHLRAAIAKNVAIGSAPWAATAQVELAELLHAQGERDEALELAAEALATAEALGMIPLQERAANVLV